MPKRACSILAKAKKVATALGLREQGYSYAEISEAMKNTSRSYAYNWCRQVLPA